jgi:hypothetical protein
VTGTAFCASGALLAQQLLSGTTSRVLHDDSVTEFFSYLTPSFIYFINNNCTFFILQAVDPTTFQLLSQMKTIFTGLLFRIFLKRKLTAVQYLALVTLACGTACSQLPVGGRWQRAMPKHADAAAPMLGGLLSVLSSLLSALGGIYNEKLLKGRPSTSIHWQNIQMYTAHTRARHERHTSAPRARQHCSASHARAHHIAPTISSSPSWQVHLGRALQRAGRLPEGRHAPARAWAALRLLSLRMDRRRCKRPQRTRHLRCAQVRARPRAAHAPRC